MSIILHYCCSLVWNMGLFNCAQLFNAGRNSRQTHSQFLVCRKKSLTFLIFDVGQLIFRDSKASMVPSTLGMCRYISHSEIVCRGPKQFENLWSSQTVETTSQTRLPFLGFWVTRPCIFRPWKRMRHVPRQDVGNIAHFHTVPNPKNRISIDTESPWELDISYYESWNFNNGNYLFTTDTK